MTITAIGKFRKWLKMGDFEVFEDDKGDVTAIDIFGAEEFEGDIPEGFIPLFEFLQLTYPKITVKKVKELMKEVAFTQIYVQVEDIDDYWAYTNHKCNTCTKKCKQSSKVEVVSCPQYEEMK